MVAFFITRTAMAAGIGTSVMPMGARLTTRTAMVQRKAHLAANPAKVKS